MVGCLTEASCCLLVSYKPLALQCSHKKGRKTQSNSGACTFLCSQTVVCAVPVHFLQLHTSVRTYSTSAACTPKCDEPSQP